MARRRISQWHGAAAGGEHRDEDERTARWEDAAARAAAGRLGAQTAQARDLVEAHRQRTAYWRACPDASRGVGRALGIVAVGYTLMGFVGALGHTGGVAALFMATPIAALTVGGLSLRRSLGPADALAARRCLRCGYSLERLPQAIDPALLDGLQVGPLECPECGLRWPLVPPPRPTTRRADAPEGGPDAGAGA
jgi:hypothetical protein